MAIFDYKGINSTGKEISGIVDADNIKLARQKLKNTGIYPSFIVEEEKRHKDRKKIPFSLKRAGKVGGLELSALYRQLATLVGAGVPLVEAISGLVSQTENVSLKKALTGIKAKINEGSSFADAAREYTNIFPDLFINMIKVGEESGTMEIILSRMADISEEHMKLKLKVRGALIYPLLMLLIGMGVIFFLMTFVIPRVTEVFKDFQTALPLPTRILLSVSSNLKNHMVGLIILTVFCLYFINRYLKTKEGKKKYDNMILRVPIFGGLFKLTAFSRFARTLAILLSSGVPLLKSLDIVSKIVNNIGIADAIQKARVSIAEGSTLADPLRVSGFFPETVIQMIVVGERSGDLETMLEKIADSFDTQSDTIVSTLTSILEPVIILVLGIGVGFIVISILLPIFEMSQLVK